MRVAGVLAYGSATRLSVSGRAPRSVWSLAKVIGLEGKMTATTEG